MAKSFSKPLQTTEAKGAAGAGSEAIDDYLKAIFQISGKPERQVSSTEIAGHLAITAASVTNMLQKLAAQEPPLVAPHVAAVVRELVTLPADDEPGDNTPRAR